MIHSTIDTNKHSVLSKPFWIVWGLELWERFGYYGVQAILALYFVQQLGYSQAQSFYIFGTFAAFVFGFTWVGGYIGDCYLGIKRTLVVGAIILMLSYAVLAFTNHKAVFYALAGIIVGNALFKTNPSSLISKIYGKGDPTLDSAMTLYYMAINVGSFLAIWIVPLVAHTFGWKKAYTLCFIGLLLGLINYYCFKKILTLIDSAIGKKPLSLKRLGRVLNLDK